MKKFKEILMPAIALFIICLVSAFLLAGTNDLTKDKIQENIEKQKIESRKEVFKTAENFIDDSVIEIDGKTVEYCVAVDGENNKLGYVFTSTNKGYGGDVSVMTAIDIEGKVIKSVVLSMDDETPGLGQNAGKEDFLKQFENKTGIFSFVKQNGENNNIEGVTSATFTSKAVIECVNDAQKAFSKLGGEQ